MIYLVLNKTIVNIDTKREVEEMGTVYGYCRISTKKQSIERQVRNILGLYPDAKIYKEIYTGTKVQGRDELKKILKKIQRGDTIVFDSVSRMSRNADEGIKLYFDLYDKGIELVFIKERHIDTASYKQALDGAGINIESDGTAEGELVSDIARAINKFMRVKAADDIRKAFEQAQKEVDALRERTKEGIETARRAGKQIGTQPGKTWQTKKEVAAKELIRKHSKTFGGTLTNEEVWTLAGVSKMSFYKYLRELKEEVE